LALAALALVVFGDYDSYPDVVIDMGTFKINQISSSPAIPSYLEQVRSYLKEGLSRGVSIDPTALFKIC